MVMNEPARRYIPLLILGESKVFMSYNVVAVVCDSVEVTDAFPALAKAFCECFLRYFLTISEPAD